jgi:hypothetical protein
MYGNLAGSGEARSGIHAVVEAPKRDFLDLHQPVSAALNRETLYYSDSSHRELASHQFVGDRIAENWKTSGPDAGKKLRLRHATS